MRLREAWLALPLLALLALATIGKGGSAPAVLLAWHAVLLAAVLLAWWFPAGGRVGRRPADGVSLAVTTFALLVVVGLLRAPYTYAAWLTALEVIAFLAALVLAVRCSNWLVTRLGLALVALGWVQTALLLVQRYAWDDLRPAGTFFNPNYLAAWLAAAILFVLGRALVTPQDRGARFVALGAFPLLAGMVVTGSRGAWIGLAAGSVWLVLRSLPSFRRRGRQAAALGAVVLVVAAAAALVVRMQQPDPFRYQRLSIWRASTNALLDAPWGGSGPGQFSRAARNYQFPDGQGPLRYDRSFATTHSDWLRAAVELGWPGVISLGWIVAATIVHAARRRRRGTPVDAGALAALTGLLVHAAFENLTRAPGVYLLAAVLFGLAVAVDGPVRRNVALGWRLAVAGFLLFCFVLGDYATWRGYAASAVGDPESAVRWNPADANAAMQRAEQISAAGRLDWERYRNARRSAERALRLSPRDGALVRRAARIEAQGVRSLFPDRANRDRVAAMYRQAQSLDRSNPFVALELATFLLDLDDPEGARRAAESALNIEPQSVAPRLVLAHAFAASGEFDRADALLAEATLLSATHAASASAGAYARDLLTLEPGAQARVVRILAAARQAAAAETRFESGDQEEQVGSVRPRD